VHATLRTRHGDVGAAVKSGGSIGLARAESPRCSEQEWSYPSIVIAPANRPQVHLIASADRAKIDRWIAEAPDFRKVETEALASDAWESRALEDGQVVFEEVEVDADTPILRRLAAWCEQQTKRLAKPPVKAGRAAEPAPLRRSAK
jgi:hypothetical protein